MDSFDETGFLSTGHWLDDWATQARKDFAAGFDVAEAVNRLAMKVLYDLPAENMTAAHVLANACYGRALQSFQGAILLAQRGMLSDATTLVRSCTESVIALASLLSDDTMPERMEKSFDLHQLKWANALLKFRKTKSTNADDDPQKVKDAITNKYGSRKPQEVNWEERAQKSGTLELYTAVYRFASGNGLHANTKALEKHIDFAETGELLGFTFAPNKSDVNLTLYFACSAMLTALGFILDKCHLSLHHSEFKKIFAEFRLLGKLDAQMRKEYLDLPPMLCARGEITLPGSKSISNRVLLLSALSEGITEIRDLLESDDTTRMLDALKMLGVNVESMGGNAYRVEGCGGKFPVKKAKLFLGNAGTAFRPLTATLALSGGHYELSGIARMHERPIGDLVDALRQAGANIAYLGNEGYPPLEILPAKISESHVVSVKGNVSSQFLTGLLMALPLLRRKMEVRVEGDLISKPYIEITLAMMRQFGVQVEHDGWNAFSIPAESRYASPGIVHVEGDASSASYFLAAGAIGGGPVRVKGVGRNSIQGDVKFAEALEKMGAKIVVGENWIEASARASGLTGLDIDCNAIPDAAMTLAVAALFAAGKTTLRNIASWKVKETDRIAAMAKELRKLGAKVVTGDDFISIEPPEKFRFAEIDTYDDHRMAMCLSLASFGTHLRINDPECVGKTFPDYFESFSKIAVPVPVIAIDGPSASGKGTVAGLVAKALGFHYLDSGALYRIAALAAIRSKIAFEDEKGVAGLAGSMHIAFENGEILLDGDIVTEEIRSEICSNGSSRVAALPSVRAALLELQRRFRMAPGLVADGRDMGSTVFPDAVLKVFLTASAEERAKRRYKQLIEKGVDVNIDTLLQDIRARDERDSRRSVAPLQKHADAELLDTTEIGIDEAVSRVLELYAEDRENFPD